MWKDFFYSTKAERQSIIAPIILVIGLYTIPALLQASPGPKKADPTERVKSEKEYSEFISSIKEAKQDKKCPVYRDRHLPFVYPKKEIRPATFDPNTASSAIFLSPGLPTWMVSSILQYRKKQGRFRHPEDLWKAYRLTEEQYRTLQPHIRIAETPILQNANWILAIQAIAPYDTSMKYPPGTIIDLNQVDTTELKKAPGIESWIARSIVDRRRLPGGLYQIEQLEETQLRAEKLRPWFFVDAGKVHRININKTSVEQMIHHPYISYYQARVTTECRKKEGKVKDLEQLMPYEEFTPADFKRMAPYTCYDQSRICCGI